MARRSTAFRCPLAPGGGSFLRSGVGASRRRSDLGSSLSGEHSGAMPPSKGRVLIVDKTHGLGLHTVKVAGTVPMLSASHRLRHARG